MGMKKIVSYVVVFVLVFIAMENTIFSAQKIGKIVYSSRGTGYKIWVMDEDGTNHHQLTFGSGVDGGGQMVTRW